MKRSLGPPWADDAPLLHIRVVYGPLRGDEPGNAIACSGESRAAGLVALDHMARAIYERVQRGEPLQRHSGDDLPF